MAKFVIKGGNPVQGTISVSGAKNAALKALAASILSDDKITINNLPTVEDVSRMIEILSNLGADISYGSNQCTINTQNVKPERLDRRLVPQLRGSTMLIGPLLVRHGSVTMPHPGGCAIGKRPIDMFIDGFKAMGAQVEETDEAYHFTAPEGLHGITFIFPRMSVSVTEALMMTACLAKEKTVLKNAACEPEVVALAEYLNQQGAKITGAGTHTMEIEGVERLSAGTIDLIPDRIEAGTFAILAAALNSELTITKINPQHLEALWLIFDKLGIPYELGDNSVKIKQHGPLKGYDIITHEYPGFVTDLQAPMTVLLTQVAGLSMVHETIFEGRLFYTDLLNRMGANIILCDPHRAIVNGPADLQGSFVESPDLRAGMAMIIAGLLAKGTTTIGNIYQIDRGYENLDHRLRSIGANIERVDL